MLMKLSFPNKITIYFEAGEKDDDDFNYGTITFALLFLKF